MSLDPIFTKNKVYKRSEIHDRFGGNRQGGISPSAKHPYIFIFSGQGGHEHGYRDEWISKDVFIYSGEGQVGDMKFVKGNLALRDHLSNGKRVFLFEADGRGSAKFITELEFFDADFDEAMDREGNMRSAIRFFFKRPEAILDLELENYETGTHGEPTAEYKITKPNRTERTGLVTSRVGQGAYRKSLLHRWNFQCAVTGFNSPGILIASHIIPWKESSDQERLDVDNGLLLSPTYDALFDRNLISFEDSGKIILSEGLRQFNYQKIGITGVESIKDISDGNVEYLERHREKVLR